MSASGVRELLQTTEGVISVARDYLGVALTPEEASRYRTTFREDSSIRWMGCDNAVSTGPVCYLKSQLLKAGMFSPGIPDESDDVPFAFVKKGKGRKYELVVSPVARSKMFTTVLKIICPIDLTTLRVAGTVKSKGK